MKQTGMNVCRLACVPEFHVMKTKDEEVKHHAFLIFVLDGSQ
jgi:hypothetical protein